MTQDFFAAESVLALDCGSTTTQALLIDRVGDEYRLIARTEAPSTLEPPWNNVASSARHAVGQLEEVIGWTLLDERVQIITPQQQAGGVDTVVIICSAGDPLRLVLAGIMRDISLISARRAISSTYAVVEGLIFLDGRRDGSHGPTRDIQAQVDLVQGIRPDAVVIVGGVDGGATRPVLQAAEATAVASITMAQGNRPAIIYAGNATLRSRVAELVGAEAELRAIDNVRPTLQTENLGPLRSEVEELFSRRKMERLPGFATLSSWSRIPVQPAAKAFAYSIEFLARLDGINVLGVDVGGAATSLASVVEEELDLNVRSDLGTSHNAVHILDHVPVEAISRWLPSEADPAEIHNTLNNKALRFRTLPEVAEELLLEQAVAREIIMQAVQDMKPHWPKGASRLYPDLLPKFHLIVAAGGLFSAGPSYGQTALTLIDALQPVGVTGMVLDKARILAPLSAVAMVNPVAAAQIMSKDALLNLGTVVAPVGTAREGETALSFKIEYEDGRSLEVEVPYGSLEVVPLGTGQTAELELRPTRRFDVGLGTKGQAATTRVEGGVIGIIIDARGRPLPVSDDPAAQRERIQRWLWDIGS
jgi:hypothetical protein